MSWNLLVKLVTKTFLVTWRLSKKHNFSRENFRFGWNNVWSLPQQDFNPENVLPTIQISRETKMLSHFYNIYYKYLLFFSRFGLYNLWLLPQQGLSTENILLKEQNSPETKTLVVVITFNKVVLSFSRFGWNNLWLLPQQGFNPENILLKRQNWPEINMIPCIYYFY